MAEKPETTSGLQQTEDTIFNSDIGDDWGEAFQAEDFMFSPDEEAGSEFFLEDDSFASDESEGAHQDSTAEDVDLFGDLNVSNGFTVFGKLAVLAASIRALPKTITIPSLGVAAALLATLLFFTHHSAPPPPELPEPLSADQISPTPAPPTDKTEATTDVEARPTTPVETAAPLAVEKVRKRWKLPSFFISTFNEEEKTTALLSIDLTFVLLLEKETVIPDDSELIVRETIFQFFNNRPYPELKRFALSRGEMTRSLTTWINKQLPDIPLSSIVFDRYQIL